MTAKGRAAADQQTGHQSGTLNLPTRSLTKADARATVPFSRRNHRVPLVALRDCKHTLCLHRFLTKTGLQETIFAATEGVLLTAAPTAPGCMWAEFPQIVLPAVVHSKA